MDKAFVGVYITKDMKVALMQLANEEKTSIAELLRDLVKRELESRK